MTTHLWTLAKAAFLDAPQILAPPLPGAPPARLSVTVSKETHCSRAGGEKAEAHAPLVCAVPAVLHTRPHVRQTSWSVPIPYLQGSPDLKRRSPGMKFPAGKPHERVLNCRWEVQPMLRGSSVPDFCGRLLWGLCSQPFVFSLHTLAPWPGSRQRGYTSLPAKALTPPSLLLCESNPVIGALVTSGRARGPLQPSAGIAWRVCT